MTLDEQILALARRNRVLEQRAEDDRETLGHLERLFSEAMRDRHRMRETLERLRGEIDTAANLQLVRVEVGARKAETTLEACRRVASFARAADTERWSQRAMLERLRSRSLEVAHLRIENEAQAAVIRDLTARLQGSNVDSAGDL